MAQEDRPAGPGLVGGRVTVLYRHQLGTGAIDFRNSIVSAEDKDVELLQRGGGGSGAAPVNVLQVVDVLRGALKQVPARSQYRQTARWLIPPRFALSPIRTPFCRLASSDAQAARTIFLRVT